MWRERDEESAYVKKYILCTCMCARVCVWGETYRDSVFMER